MIPPTREERTPPTPSSNTEGNEKNKNESAEKCKADEKPQNPALSQHFPATASLRIWVKPKRVVSEDGEEEVPEEHSNKSEGGKVRLDIRKCTTD